MLTANVYEIKTKLSYYLNQVQKGKKVIISKRNVPIAEIKLIAKQAPKRVTGQSDEKFEVPKDFFKPLPENILNAFNDPI